MSSRNVPLDALRGLAVASVVGFHCQVAGMSGGLLGVDVFFAISGCVITRSLLEERSRTGQVALRRFWGRRLVRLYPPLLLSVALGALLAERLPPHGDLGGYAWSSLTALTYTKDLSLAVHPGATDGLGHTWSLGLEEQFYLLWPPLLVGLLSLAARGRAAVVGLGAIAVASTGLLSLGTPTTGFPDTYYLPQCRLGALALGAMAAIVLRHGPDQVSRALGATWTAVAGVALIACAWVDLAHHPGRGAFEQSLVRLAIPLADLGAGLLVAHLAARPGALTGRLLSGSRIARIGARSYSLYLVNLPVALWILTTDHDPDQARAIAVAVTVAAGVLVHAVAERPALRWAAQLKAGPRGGPSPASSLPQIDVAG